MELKQCSICKEWKTLDCFSPRSRRGFVDLHAACKPCRVIQNMAHRQKRLKEDAEYKRHFLLKNKYGLSIHEYNRILESQDYKCAICGTLKCCTGHSFAVDHNHATGEIRGLLCAQCNRGLGMFKDDFKLLLRAIAYLLRPPPFVSKLTVRYKQAKE